MTLESDYIDSSMLYEAFSGNDQQYAEYQIIKAPIHLNNPKSFKMDLLIRFGEWTSQRGQIARQIKDQGRKTMTDMETNAIKILSNPGTRDHTTAYIKIYSEIFLHERTVITIKMMKARLAWFGY